MLSVFVETAAAILSIFGGVPVPPFEPMLSATALMHNILVKMREELSLMSAEFAMMLN